MGERGGPGFRREESFFGLELDLRVKVSRLSSLFSGSLNIWMGVIGAAFLAFSSHGADQPVVQQVWLARAADGRKAMVLSAVVILPLFALFLFVGVGLWVYYQANPVVPIEIPEIRPGVKKNDYLFPIFILTEIPMALGGSLSLVFCVQPCLR